MRRNRRVTAGRSFLVLLVVGCCTSLFAASAGAVLPAGFANELVIGGLNQPIDMAFLPDGRALLLHKGGEILIVDLDALPPTASPYMTIADIYTDGEQGLLGVALDPDFANNDYFYVYYSKASAGKLRIARFTHLGNSADLASEFLVWENPQENTACCHYGGALSIGPEGAIYLTTGENFDADQSQDLTRAGGKVIRVNLDGSIPVDNPFVDGPFGNVDAVWAFGLRNPFRSIWDLPGNRFLIGEVGGNNQSLATEDVHLGVKGANYGWPICEGDCLDPIYDDPIFFYNHNDNGASITGGFAYRGASFPVEFEGAYFYGDYVREWIRYLTFNPDGSVAGDFDFEDAAGGVVAIREGLDGALYYIDIFGEFRRIIYAQGNLRPVIDQATASVTDGTAPLSVTFTGMATDPESQPLTYTWFFGDGNKSNSAVVAYDYTSNGVYVARLSVSDGVHTIFSETIEIRVGIPPEVSISEPINGFVFQAGELISLTGMATDADGPLLDSDYSWVVFFNHNLHNHPNVGPLIGSMASFTVDDSGHDFSDDTGFDVVLTVTDVDGLTGTDLVTIVPDKVNISFTSNQAGATIDIDGIPRTPPFVLDSLIGFYHEVSAPTQQCINDTNYVFSSWSDSGAATHLFQVPSSNSSLDVQFVADGPCFLRVTDGLLALYDFQSGSGTTVFDQSGVMPALDLTISDPAAVSWIGDGGLSVDSPTSIKTLVPATRLRDALQATETLTIEVWVKPANLTQFGPARIVAYSENGFPDGGNFMLGQSFDSGTGTAGYAARLRTTATNQYGTPNLDSPMGLATLDLTHLVYTRDGSGLTRLYRDGVQVVQSSRGGLFASWGDYELSLANEPSEDRPWLGELHLVAIYDRALDGMEVETNYQAGPDDLLLASAVPAIANGRLAVLVASLVATALWLTRREAALLH